MTYQQELKAHIATGRLPYLFVPSEKYRNKHVLYTRVAYGTFAIGDRIKIIGDFDSAAPSCENQNRRTSPANYSKMVPFMRVSHD